MQAINASAKSASSACMWKMASHWSKRQPLRPLRGVKVPGVSGPIIALQAAEDAAQPQARQAGGRCADSRAASLGCF